MKKSEKTRKIEEKSLLLGQYCRMKNGELRMVNLSLGD
jgi:hypothetical protein